MTLPALHDWHLLMPPAPRLKPHVAVYRHIYAGTCWYVFHDRAADRYYRATGDGARVLAALDGVRSIEEICQPLAAADDAQTIAAEDVSLFLGQLDSLGLLESDAPAALADSEARARTRRQERSWWANISNPLFLRLPLFNPEPLIGRLYPRLTWLFGRWGAIGWAGLVLVGALIAGMHWNALTDNLTDRMFSAENLMIAWSVYPFVKIVHELAHGLALHHVGGRTRMTGLLFITFIPMPYVDASESAVLERKGDRMLVAGAGILAELAMGALALIGWVLAEPGLFRSVCATVTTISGFSTLLFNGNPLQRFDGYYLLSDLVEVPGLASRASVYLGGLVRRHLLREDDIPQVQASRYEVAWFVVYGPASFLYRTALMISIALYAAEYYPVVGAMLAAWTLFGMIRPLVVGVWHSLGGRDGAGRRRGYAGLAAAIAGLAGLFLLPVPHGVVAQGYTDVPDDSMVRVGVAGTVAQFLVEPGAMVTAGQPLVRLESAEVIDHVARQKGRVAEMDATYAREFVRDQVKGAIAEQKLAQAREELAGALRDRDALTVRSPAAGQVLFTNGDDMPGRFVAKGEMVARIWAPERSLIKVAVPLMAIAPVRAEVQGVDIRPGWDPLHARPGTILRMAPQPSDKLPSPVLSLEGGGPFAASRDAGDQVKVDEPLFLVDVAPAAPPEVMFLGGRSHVRFDLGTQSLGLQLFRKIRLTFLRRMNV